ncbi:Major Facilitator Superfamily protein [Thalassoglobus neptunius]|uniref:Major Facilitator Superfamily protein n=1 Tax=Thalassoglobus neptunius TaxID=1938619 RepID=A0A5C5WR92_9PLAN|nr:MFS transporter [Thalassoglobus neptunius]TWT52332.1 Major Facilitator Superfamily protein [Thalassoglobus neptunius]
MPNGTRKFSTETVTRLVMLSQALFTAGNSLTTGGFLNYFIYEFEQSALYLAAIQVAPECAESLGVFTRRILYWFRGRKRLWICGLIIARLTALVIPAVFLFLPERFNNLSLSIILAAIIVWYLAQGISYCAYISWLSDLVPEQNWGTFFSRRRIAGLIVSIIVPTSFGLLRSRLISEWPSDCKLWSYLVIFGTGAALALSSILPMLSLPETKTPITTKIIPKYSRTRWKELSPSFRWLLCSRWWLAFFQGLTQVALFKFSVSVLHVSLETYYVLTAMMLLLQIVAARWAGAMCDRDQDRKITILGLLIVSCAMPFWMTATPQFWWLIVGANLAWGAFGIVNVGLQNLTLKLAPVSDNSLHISLSRQWSGLIAGIAGLLGGYYLDWAFKQSEIAPNLVYTMIFGVSWFGRMTAPLFLLPVVQPTSRQSASDESLGADESDRITETNRPTS